MRAANDMATEVQVVESGAPPTSLPRLLTLPLWGLVRPRAAAASLATISPPAWAALLALSLCAYAAVLIGLMLWDQTMTEVWVPAPASAPTSAPGGYPIYWSGSTELRQRTLAEVWAGWRVEALAGWFGPAELTLALVVTLGMVLIALLAWLNLPFVHRSGSVGWSYKRVLRAMAGVFWPLTGLTFVCGAVFVFREHASYGSAHSAAMLAEPGVVLMVLISAAVWPVVWWLCGAVRGIEVLAPDLSLPPRCEGCGYDLTHRAADGLCTECGLPQVESLDPRRNRPGSAWSQHKCLASWMATAVASLLRPREFYRAARLRAPLRADSGFATLNLVLIACAALLWAGLATQIMSLRHGPLPDDFPVFLAALIALGTFGCWLGHRVIAAVVVSWWLARVALPDFRWATKAIEYESSYLWVFCVFWGLMLSSLLAFETWISRLIGFAGFFPAGEFLAIVGGTLLLAVIWLIRYTIAYRAIRWSNF